VGKAGLASIEVSPKSVEPRANDGCHAAVVAGDEMVSPLSFWLTSIALDVLQCSCESMFRSIREELWEQMERHLSSHGLEFLQH
jgi:hypothetical protein